MKKRISNIVIFRTDRIGEVLLSTVAIDCLKKEFPEAHITFVTSSYSKPIVEDRSDLAEVMVFDTLKKVSFPEAVSLSKKLKKGHFDLAIILNPHKYLHLACFLAGIPIRLGYDRKWGWLLNKKIQDTREEGKKHEVEYTLDLLKTLGMKCQNMKPYLPVVESCKKVVQGLDSSIPIIAIHPGSSNPAKLWPVDNYIRLVQMISEGVECNVAIIGTKGEAELAKKIQNSSCGKAIDLTSRFNLKELAAFLSNVDVFIGNDTGPMHMAAALGVPIIAIFGRSIPGVSPDRWGPWGADNVVLHENVGCDPCYDTKCPYEYKCLKAVTCDKVFEKLKEILKKKST